MNFRRLILLLGVCLAVSSFTGYAFAQCDQCSHPRVGLYDADVLIPRPSIPDSVPNWWTLQWPMSVARSTLFNGDPTRDCVTWYDGAVINAFARDSVSGHLVAGQDYPNLPQDGAINSLDYLLTGTVSGGSGAFTLTLTLQTAVSRETVVSKQASFGYDQTSQLNAGQFVASAMMPILQTIRTFEVDKRNNDVTVAIRDMWSTTQSPWDIVLKPAKWQVDTGETIDVNIQMTDCDGVPLGNRTIYFHDTTINDIPLGCVTTGGEVNPTVVTTDGDGSAKVQFKAGHTKGAAQILAAYPHKKPCGRASAFMGTATLTIKEPPTNFWVIDVIISEGSSSKDDSSSSGSVMGLSWSYDSHDESYSDGSARIRAIVPNFSSTPGEFEFDPDAGEPIEIVASGSMSDNEFSQLLGTFVTPDIRSDHTSGSVVPGSAYVRFVYSEDFCDASAAVACYRIGGYEGKWSDGNEWHSYTGKYNDSTGFEEEGETGDSHSTFSKSDSGFSATYVDNETEVQGGGATMTTNSLTMTVGPYNSLTPIKNRIESATPAEFSLSQNYPNPFNPSTVITYQLPVVSHVTLKVYDILGREVATLVDERKSPGTYEVKFDGSRFASGVYFCRMTAGNYVSTHKLLLLK